MSVNIKKDIRRCEICGKVYDANEAFGLIDLNCDRPDDSNRYHRSRHEHADYHMCLDCYDKLFETVNNMIIAE